MSVLKRLRPEKKPPEPPSESKPSVAEKVKTSIRGWPRLYKDTPYGDCVLLEHHIRVNVFVRDDEEIRGGEVWPIQTWRDTHNGKLPWNETESDDVVPDTFAPDDPRPVWGEFGTNETVDAFRRRLAEWSRRRAP